jgi:hypothetical protein
MRGTDELTLAIILNRLRSACLELACRRNSAFIAGCFGLSVWCTRPGAREKTRAVWLFSRHCDMPDIRRK